MIGIVKGEAPPELTTSGTVAARSLCDLYQADSAGYDTGAKRFQFRGGVYASVAVKTALEAVQASKCCYCERKITGVASARI